MHTPNSMAGQQPGRASLADLNDALRRHGRGGRVMVSAGIAAMPAAELAAVLQAVAQFAAFTPDNDPYGEHDCATLTVAGAAIVWKIGAYDRTLTAASPDPIDPAVTTRVLTVMLASEY